MRDITEIYGQRLQSDKPIIMVYGSPTSGTFKTLPPGKPSPLIDSYLPSGLFVVEGDSAGNYYIQDEEGIIVIPPDAKDESSIIDTGAAWIGDRFQSVETTAKKKAGYLEEGFEKSVSEFKVNSMAWIADIRGLLIVVAVLYVIITINQIFRQ